MTVAECEALWLVLWARVKDLSELDGVEYLPRTRTAALPRCRTVHAHWEALGEHCALHAHAHTRTRAHARARKVRPAD